MPPNINKDLFETLHNKFKEIAIKYKKALGNKLEKDIIFNNLIILCAILKTLNDCEDKNKKIELANEIINEIKEYKIHVKNSDMWSSTTEVNSEKYHKLNSGENLIKALFELSHDLRAKKAIKGVKEKKNVENEILNSKVYYVYDLIKDNHENIKNELKNVRLEHNDEIRLRTMPQVISNILGEFNLIIYN